MRKVLLLASIFIATTYLFAQKDNDPCSFILDKYDKKIEECTYLSNDMKRLRRDSVQLSKDNAKLTTDTTQLQKSLREIRSAFDVQSSKLKQTEQMLKVCRKDSMKMQQLLKQCSTENIQRYKDSIDMLNQKINVLSDSVAHLADSDKRNTKYLQEQSIEIARLNSLVKYLDSQFSGKSVDELYRTTDKRELEMCIDLYHHLGKHTPLNIQMVINCFEAEQLVNTKYDPLRMKQYLAVLPQNTKVGKVIAQRLQNYETVNTAARQLWENIQSEVCSEEIPNENFRQVQSKRQIWQRTQKFLNRYPTLATDYPYIFDQLQSMLRQIWDNANNFNKISNPF